MHICISSFLSKHCVSLSVCDPVMGDEGKLYVPQELVSVYRERVRLFHKDVSAGVHVQIL